MKHTLILTGTALLLTACGGGGGGSDHNAASDTSIPTSNTLSTFTATIEPDAVEDYQYIQINIDGKTFITADTGTLRHTLNPNVIAKENLNLIQAHVTRRDPQGKTRQFTTPMRAYRGDFSGVYIFNQKEMLGDSFSSNTLAEHYFTPTTAAQLPTGGKATYWGRALGLEDANIATFFYDIDFGRKSGTGKVAANAYHGELNLIEGKLQNFTENGHSGFKIEAPSTGGSYELILSGDQAQEISGYLDYYLPQKDEHEELGLHGTRGLIAP